MAHTKFTYNWNWDGAETEILSRCTDEIGQVQPTRAQVAKFFGVPEDHDHSFNVPGNDNSIQPWRIARDGSVHNAIA
jgi:sulfane dehydrogenase subunit SoxC